MLLVFNNNMFNKHQITHVGDGDLHLSSVL